MDSPPTIYVGRAMVLAGNALFVAGPTMGVGRKEPEFNNAERSAVLMAFNIENGEALIRHALDTQPFFDGMAAARGRLYISTVGGTVVCLGKDDSND